MEDGGRRGGNGELFPLAVGGMSTSPFDTVRLVMLGGGRKFPLRSRQFVCRAPIRKRSLPTIATFDQGAACRAAAEISTLRQQLASVTAKLQRTGAAFQHKVDVAVRNGVRKARIASDTSVYHNLAKLKDEVTSLRNAAYCQVHHTKLTAKVVMLEGDLAARDAELAKLMFSLLSYEKNDTLGKRRLANVSNTVGQHEAAMKAHKLELQSRDKQLRARDTQLKLMTVEVERLKSEVDAALQREATHAEKACELRK
mmetsp:Transcript_5831/g.12743  ORF Transcript_5831/g.12743 Transcript_5831/m.12743 type:complete len:255 (-) Transcript_5831:2879-3643(-)